MSKLLSDKLILLIFDLEVTFVFTLSFAMRLFLKGPTL